MTPKNPKLPPDVDGVLQQRIILIGMAELVQGKALRLFVDMLDEVREHPRMQAARTAIAHFQRCEPKRNTAPATTVEDFVSRGRKRK